MIRKEDLQVISSLSPLRQKQTESCWETCWGQQEWYSSSRRSTEQVGSFFDFWSLFLFHPLGFIMLTQPCSLWPICQTLLALSICLDLDWIKAPADKMMATSAPVWKTLRVCPADPLALSHPQANHSQSQGCRGEVSEESQHLIGELQRVRFFIFFPISGGLGTAAHSSFLNSK